MPIRHKAALAQKVCVQCNRPFAWRKKWERVWAEVKYCSDRCRKAPRAARAQSEPHPTSLAR